MTGPLAQGKIDSWQVKRLDDELGDGDAFITLYNSRTTSNSGAILDLRIKDDSFSVRESVVVQMLLLATVLC